MVKQDIPQSSSLRREIYKKLFTKCESVIEKEGFKQLLNISSSMINKSLKTEDYYFKMKKKQQRQEKKLVNKKKHLLLMNGSKTQQCQVGHTIILITIQKKKCWFVIY